MRLTRGGGCCCGSDGHITPARADRGVRYHKFSEGEQLCDLALDAAYSCGVGAVVDSLLHINAGLLVLVAPYLTCKVFYLAFQVCVGVGDLAVCFVLASPVCDLHIFVCEALSHIQLIAVHHLVFGAAAGDATKNAAKTSVKHAKRGARDAEAKAAAATPLEANSATKNHPFCLK